MNQIIVNDLLDQYKRATLMFRSTIQRFTPEQWRSGITWFQVPVKLAYHTIDCLDYYFREDPAQAYTWGHRFAAPWWELPEEGQPSQQALLQYLAEVEEHIIQHLSTLQDDDLSTPYDTQQEHAVTRLGHYVYALRHTMHHHGALTLLSIHHGHKEEEWA